MNNKTLADILAEMRSGDTHGSPRIYTIPRYNPQTGHYDIEGVTLDDLADRIEAACAPQGNATALRDALEKIVRIAEEWDTPGIHAVQATLYRILEAARAALSAPPRNCDMFADSDYAFAAWHDSLKDGDVVSVCNAFAWLFAPAEGGAEC